MSTLTVKEQVASVKAAARGGRAELRQPDDGGAGGQQHEVRVRRGGLPSDRMCIWSADTNAPSRSEFTIIEVARQAGMATFHSGKWHVGAMSGRVQNAGLCGCNRSKSMSLPNHEKLWPKDCAPGTSCTISGPAQTGFGDGRRGGEGGGLSHFACCRLELGGSRWRC